MRMILRMAMILPLLAASGPVWAQAQSQMPTQSPPTAGGPSQPGDTKRVAALSIAKIRGYCAEWAETDFSKLKDPFLAGYCLGLVQAFRDGVALGTASTLAFIKEVLEKGRKDRRASYNRWCHPTAVPNQFLVGAFMDWSGRHPDFWHLPYSVGFYEAFREEWPCETDDVQVESSPTGNPEKSDNQK